MSFIFQFFIAATLNAIFAANQTLLSDLYRGKAVSSTAINNLVKFSMRAIGEAFIEQMIVRMGVASGFLALEFATISLIPLAVVQ